MPINQDTALHNARASAHYLGHDGMHALSTWVTSAVGRLEYPTPAPAHHQGNEVSHPPTIFSGLFQVSHQNFYLEPDMSFNPDRLASWQQAMGAKDAFAQGRGSLILCSVPPSYPALHAEYNKYVDNLDELMRNVLPRCSQSGFRIRDTTGTTFKLSHTLFEPRTTEGNNRSTGNSSDAATAAIEELDQHVLPIFRIANLPVSPACRPLLEEIVPTHQFNPLLAFEEGSQAPILPAEYGPKLRGAIVEARFTLSHKIINRSGGPTSHFVATVDEMIILGMPTEVSLSPSKSRHEKLFRNPGLKRKELPSEPEAGPSNRNQPKRARK